MSTTEQAKPELFTKENENVRSQPRGAALIAILAVSALFIGWLLFYFILFMRRGYVG